MREMKDSGIYYLGEIPKEWAIQKFKNFSKSRMGETILLEETGEEGVPIYSATQEDKIFGYTKNAKFLLSKDDIVIPARGNSIGCATLVKNERATCTQTTIGCYDIKNINNKFYYYSILGLKDEWFKYDGSAIPQITVEQVKNNKLAIPEYAEQQRIVDFLDKKVEKIDSIIKKTKETIEDYKKYKQSIITEVVTRGLDRDVEVKDSGIDWIGKIPIECNIKKIKNLGTARNGLTYSPEDLCDESEGILVLRSSNIQDGKLDFKDNVYVKKEIKEELFVNENDILICSRNGSKNLIGKNALISNNLKATFGAFMMIYRCNTNAKYLKYILDSEVFKYYLGTFLTSTINQLTYDNFANMKIVYNENEKEQVKIVNYLDKKCNEINNLIKSKENIIEELERYKKSLIYEYVTGKKQVI